MISKEYIIAYKNFVILELELLAQYVGSEYSNRMANYYNAMYKYISAHQDEFMLFDKSAVKFYELEFAEAVEPIRNKLIALAQQKQIQMEILFLPRVKLPNGKWDRIISTKVVSLVRDLYDKDPSLEFETMRQYQSYPRVHKLVYWTVIEGGKKAIKELSAEKNLPSKNLVVKQLKLFDNEFVIQQKQWFSREIWVHRDLVNRYNCTLTTSK